jgi:hypothetical protein
LEPSGLPFWVWDSADVAYLRGFFGTAKHILARQLFVMQPTSPTTLRLFLMSVFIVQQLPTFGCDILPADIIYVRIQ